MSNTPQLPAVLVGRFWLADHDENKLPGRLTLAEGASPRLELDQPLSPPLRELDRQEQPNGTVTRRLVLAEDGPGYESLVVHGVLEDGTQVTLLDTFTVAREGDRQWLGARSALLGGHVGGPDELYTRIRLRLRHLDAWAALPGFSRELDPDQGRATVEFRRCDPDPVSLEGGGQLELEQTASIDFSPVLGGGIRRVVWLRIVDLPLDLPRPPTADELSRRFVTPLASLVTLATGTDCPPVAVELATGPDEPWLTVHHSGLRSAADEVLSLHDQLVPLEVLELGRVVTWLRCVENLTPLPPVIAAAAVGAGRTLESDLLELTTAAEGLHQRLFPDCRCLNYRQRLRQLAKNAKDAVPGVTGQTECWISCVVAIRNEFAHRSSSGFLERTRIPELLAVRQSLCWLLAGLLLLQTGLPADVLAAQIEQHQPYRLFRQQARKWLPRVFPPLPDQ